MNSLMERISTGLEKYLVPIMNKMNNNRYLTAIKDALISTMALTILGSFCLLIAYFPFPQSYVSFMEAHPDLVNIICIPFNLTVGIISLYVAFGIGYNLAKAYDLDKLIGGGSAVFTFLIMAGGIDGGYLGATGMFTAIIAGILAVEILRLCLKKNIGFKLPKTVPGNIASGFEALVPNCITAALVIVLVYVIGFDVNNILAMVLTPIITAAGNSLVTALLYVILATLMWFAGIHPQILATLLTPAWEIMAVSNMEAFAAGAAIPYIFCKPFFFTFVFIGGQCGTLMLNLIMLRSKSRTHRDLAKLALPAGIFNINEPMLFGLPIVLNATLIIPALLGQVLTVFTTWGAFATGLVPGMGNPNAAIWDMPGLIAGGLCTASWQGVVLVAVNMLLQGILYIPFYRIVEKQMLEQEKGVVA